MCLNDSRASVAARQSAESEVFGDARIVRPVVTAGKPPSTELRERVGAGLRLALTTLRRWTYRPRWMTRLPKTYIVLAATLVAVGPRSASAAFDHLQCFR
jgi:hypothetical protein